MSGASTEDALKANEGDVLNVFVQDETTGKTGNQYAVV